MKDKEKIRALAAVAALPVLIKKLPLQDRMEEAVATIAVFYADALVNELYKEEDKK